MSAKQTSKRPSSRTLRLSDDVRVPVPGLEPAKPRHARYLITPLGHVYRDDGRLLIPTWTRSATGAIKINFNGGTQCRSLPSIVFKAFGKPGLVRRHAEGDLRGYDVWVDPLGPIDELTERLRCSVQDVYLVPHGELIRWGRRGIRLKTLIPIV